MTDEDDEMMVHSTIPGIENMAVPHFHPLEFQRVGAH